MQLVPSKGFFKKHFNKMFKMSLYAENVQRFVGKRRQSVVTNTHRSPRSLPSRLERNDDVMASK